ncbi:MAG: Gfo/Idh/MocA family oxidoreductase, partial [Lachnospiraceae bacterium]|nr:Gfo/Idh/MocA family oxidoreductase [Lachnospiraceae bacterium]
MESVETIKKILEEATLPPKPVKNDYRIGCVGSGFIMRDCHLVSYRNASFNPVAIASRTKAHAEEVAQMHSIPIVFDTWQELVKDPHIEILDIAYPPDQQPEIVREAVKNPNIKGILCQKPIAMDLAGAREIAELGEKYGKKIAVNSNMRYDQSMRALKKLLDMKELGDIVIATIEMRAIPHWQTFLVEYDKLVIFGMGIHHVDSFRYLFGDPDAITCVCRTDPRSKFPHVD